MTIHAKFSPSKSHIWTQCAGSVNFSENQDLKSSEKIDAIDGIRAHYLLENAIRTNVHPKRVLLGIKHVDQYGEWSPNDDMIAAVGVAFDYVLLRSHEINAVPVCEDFVDPSSKVGGIRGEMDGRCDVYIKSNVHLEVIEFKYGMGEIQVVDNTQLELCVAGVIAKFTHEQYHPRYIQMTVVQPRIAVLGQDTIKTMMTDISTMNVRWQFIAEALLRARQETPTLTAGSWCKHCLAQGKCSINNEQSLDVLGFNPVNVVDQSMKYINPTDVSDEQLVEIFTAKKQINEMLSACSEELTKRAQHKTIKGVKLVQGNGSKSWDLTETELVSAAAEQNIPFNALYTKRLISPAQALKLSWSEGDGKKISLNKTQKDLFEQKMTIHKGKPTLVLKNDSRKAIGASVEEHFKDAKVDAVIPDWA